MSLEQTVDNLEIRYANAVTFVGTSNTMIDTTTGRIQTKGIQHNSNVITDVSGPHGRVAPSLKKYPEIVFEEGKFDRNDTTNTYVQAGYTVSASSQNSSTADRFAYQAFNSGATIHEWRSSGGAYTGADGIYDGTTHRLATTDTDGDAIPYGEWLKIKMPKKIQLNSVVLKGDPGFLNRTPEDFKIYGSNDGNTWKLLITQTNLVPVNGGNKISPTSTLSVYYDYYALVTTKLYDATQTDVAIEELEYYGYEEYIPAGDHSVDTTFMSRFNNPQLTGVQVLVDGATEVGTNQISGGPDPSGNQSTYVTDGKYWTLNGTLTSNLAVEANTFLSGDAPHSISTWFNSSNLEANVSNTCVFSISDQEKLDSVNLDLQSNTWHNLTYAYQGEGGSRVTYLDGRKVAEDQAEDTFGDYPPFAMTGLSQGGYVLSTNGSITAGSTNASPHYAFDNQINNFFGFGRMDQTGTGTDQTGGPTMPGTVDGSTLPSGYWLKLELPHKLRVNSYNITPRGDLSQPNSSPLTWKVYGSNDDSVWTLLHEKTDSTPINPWVSTTDNPGSTFAVSTIGSFKYLALIVLTNAGYAYLNLGELRYYGHRENDLVRLPDPTNVLKYPHIAFPNSDGTAVGGNVAPSIRGYVATTDDANPSFPIGKVFDERYQTSGGDSGQRWQPVGEHYPSNGGVATSTNLTLTTLGNGTTYRGNYIQLESPHKLNITKYQIYSGAAVTTHRPTVVVLVGSNTGNTNDWVDLGSGDTTLPAYSGSDPDYSTTAAISNTGFYKYHRLIIRAVHSTPLPVVFQVKFYGTGVDSVPIQIGGGNIDKVANFRVYDTFVGEDQALEIWDAQKDEFDRAKSSMTLQKGRLGIGTTEPEGRLAVADEPHNLEEFPPRAMTGYETYMEGHGEFCASASSEFSGTYRAWDAFNHTGTSDSTDAWLAPMNRYTLNGYIDVDPSVAADINGVYGEWLELKLPYKITLDRLTIKSRAGSPYGQPGGAAAGNVWGSNDGVNWTLLTSFTGLTYGGVATTIGVQENVVVNSTTPYSYFRLQPTKRVGVSATDGWVGVGELRYFGTREQGQSVLHDGQLTLTKSLTVPRIGPALDADDTPRRDRLVVEYNTSTNPTFEGAVRDTGGRGNDGVFVGTASYDATEKAFTFPGTVTNNIYTGNLGPDLKGNQQLTVSLWFKTNVDQDQSLFSILPGDSDEDTYKNFQVRTEGNSTNYNLSFIYWSSDYRYNVPALDNPQGKWFHLVAMNVGGTKTANGTTYDRGDPSNRRLFLNGVELFTPSSTTYGSAVTGDASAILNLDPNSRLIIGSRFMSSGQYPVNGSISNFKLYDTTLTAEEVKTLYDMGRNGSVANPQPLHIAAPLYAPGTVVQVEQSIKRDDSSTASTSVSDIPGLSVTIHPKFGTSKILVSYQVNMGGNYHMFLRVKRTQNGTTTYVGNGDASGNRPLASSYQSHLHVAHVNSMNMEILDPSNGTSPITYQLQFWVSASNYTAYINRSYDNYNNMYGPGALSSSITVKEVCQ